MSKATELKKLLEMKVTDQEAARVAKQYYRYYKDYTFDSLVKACKKSLEENEAVDAMTLDYYMKPKKSGGLGMGEKA